jgi:8-oxo-dGTP pyrophosphatase MutT (NUDIX family)
MRGHCRIGRLERPAPGYCPDELRGGSREQRTKLEPDDDADSPRIALAAELRLYRLSHPDEWAIADRFIEFVETNGNCFSRSCLEGHVTGSAFIVDSELKHVLFVHHAKLGLWLQPGGHCESGETAAQAAKREAFEETGAEAEPWHDVGLFDIDIHRIPARADVPSHFHYDARYLFVARVGQVTVSEESHAVEWLDFSEAIRRNDAASITRPIAKLG